MTRVCVHEVCDYWNGGERCIESAFCPECFCAYGSPAEQAWCRDGACDCHHEPTPQDSEDGAQ